MRISEDDFEAFKAAAEHESLMEVEIDLTGGACAPANPHITDAENEVIDTSVLATRSEYPTDKRHCLFLSVP